MASPAWVRLPAARRTHWTFDVIPMGMEALSVRVSYRVKFGISMVILFSVVSVCVSVCLSVCQHDNSRTVRDIITKFSGHHPMVERAEKFQNDCIEVRGWWFNFAGAQVCFIEGCFSINGIEWCSGVGGFEGSGGVRASSLSVAASVITGWTVVQALCYRRHSAWSESRGHFSELILSN